MHIERAKEIQGYAMLQKLQSVGQNVEALQQQPMWLFCWAGSLFRKYIPKKQQMSWEWLTPASLKALGTKYLTLACVVKWVVLKWTGCKRSDVTTCFDNVLLWSNEYLVASNMMVIHAPSTLYLNVSESNVSERPKTKPPYQNRVFQNRVRRR